MQSASLLNSLPVQQITNLLQGWSIGYSGVKFKNAFSVRCKKDTRGQKATCSTERRYLRRNPVFLFKHSRHLGSRQ